MRREWIKNDCEDERVGGAIEREITEGRFRHYAYEREN